MEQSILLQRVDPERRAYRWYRITLQADGGDLFHQPKVVIERGRIGEVGETIERYFDGFPEAARYFDRKLSERQTHGYVAVGGVDPLLDVRCGLCGLLTRATEDACFVYDFPRSVLFVNWDQTYMGRSMLVFKKHLPDFFRLAPSELLASLGEIRRSEMALRNAFSPKLMNYLFMGNSAGHVHIHLVPRYASDPDFGKSPFLDTNRAVEPQTEEARYRELAERIRRHLPEP